MKALEHSAFFWKTDLVICPFGFTRSDEQLSRVMERITFKGCTVLAASSNSGANDSICVPASDPNAIPIYPSDAWGNKENFSPPPSDRHWNFSTMATTITYPKRRISTGSSSATVVAGAVVATTLQYVQQRLELQDEESRRLRTKHGIEQLLALMSRKRDGYDYVAPWVLWSDDADEDFIDAKLRALIGRRGGLVKA
jgi:hypothetical protein